MLSIVNEAKRREIGLGDMIKKLTDYFGIEQCPRCQRWQVFLNQLRLRDYKIEWDKIP